MQKSVLEFKNCSERQTFIRAVWQRIKYLHSKGLNYIEMTRPYNLLLKAAYSGSSSILLWGGLYDSALFALSHSEEDYELCLMMIDRIKRAVQVDE